MNDLNGSTLNGSAVPASNLDADYADRQLRVLSEQLEECGLEARLVTYPVGGVKGEHYDAVVVTNPVASERGKMHFESDGCVSWEYDGTLDSAGIDRAVDEAVNALRAAGVRSRPGQRM